MLQSAIAGGGGIAAAAGSGGAQGSSSANMVGGRAATASAGGSALLTPTASLPRAIPGGQRHPNSGRGRGRSGRSSGTTTTRTAATTAGSSKSSVSTNAVVATAAAPTAAPTPPAANAPLPDLGYSRGIEDKYEWGKELGRGGNGVVRVVRDRKTGDEWACKSLPKAAPASAGDRKRAGHLDALRREVEVLRRLEGSLNVVRLVDVYEDDEHVHLVQEWCRGGELHHRVGGRAAGFGGAAAGTAPTASERQAHHYSERTVASFMRAVLRTLAQCHAQHILHRDVKPGNFMLLDDSERSPLRAIDFGLATPYDPDALPLDNLGLEGTPWYMAPEVLSSKVTPASDVWSAGVMAAQLLTGRLPFDDHRNPIAPSLSAVWRSVLTDEVNFNMPWWRDVSPEAREFVSALLDRDPSKRPTAREALQHPWLKGDSQDRARGKPLDASVVQRLQRFAQNSRFKRSVLQLIAEELLAAPAGAGAGVIRGGSSNATAAAAAVATSAAAGGSTTGGAAAAATLLSSSVDAGGSTHHGVNGGASTDEGGSTHHGTEAGGSSHHGTDAGGSTHRGLASASGATLGSAGSLGGAITRPDASPMLALLERLKFGSADYVDRRQAEEALARMGYRLEPSELGRLVDVVDSSHSGRVRRAALVASQIDWRALQRGTPGSSGSSSGALRDEWLDVAARAFRALDRDGDGLLRAEEIVSSLRVKLPEDELRATLAQVMEEAGGGAAVGMMGAGAGAPQQHADALDFDGFLRMLRVGSLDSLDLYDDRLALNGGSAHGANGGSGDSTHGRARAAAAALAAAGELTAAARAAEAKPWLRPHVSFNFNFGFDGGNGAAAEGEGKEAGAAAAAAADREAEGAEGGASSALGDLAASYFREPAVRGGGHFDSRMHGASLYRNNALAGSSSHAHLATVKE